MALMHYTYGYISVYDQNGNFLFTADSEYEAREEMKEYAQYSA